MTSGTAEGRAAPAAAQGGGAPAPGPEGGAQSDALAALRTVPLAPARATRLVLVRHGEAVCNVAGVVGGVLGCTGLTPRGVRQVTALRDRLARSGELQGLAALYSSVLLRAVETATILAPALAGTTGTPPALRQDCSLCELHPGEGDGLEWDAFVERYGTPEWDVDPHRPLSPGGESWSDFVDRAAQGLSAVADAHPGQLVVVVCHAGVVEAALLSFLPMDRSGSRRQWLRTEHASMTELERPGAAGSAWILRGYNDFVPIPDEPPAGPGPG